MTSSERGCCTLSTAVEDYLKAVFHLESADEACTTTAVAARVEVSVPSASMMLKRLRAQQLVADAGTDDRAVALTDHGRRHARSVVRRHRLLETFLAEVLELPWDAVHDEAEVLEHALSPKLEARISALLGDPSVDPHGDPIPPADGPHEESWPQALDQVEDGSVFTVTRVSDREPDALRYLAERGIELGARLRVLRREPFGGPLVVGVDDAEVSLGTALAGRIHGQVAASS